MAKHTGRLFEAGQNRNALSAVNAGALARKTWNAISKTKTLVLREGIEISTSPLTRGVLYH